MVTLPLYHICLFCAAIESLLQGGLPPQGADKAYVILLPEATYVSQNGFFALLMSSPIFLFGRHAHRPSSRMVSVADSKKHRSLKISTDSFLLTYYVSTGTTTLQKIQSSKKTDSLTRGG